MRLAGLTLLLTLPLVGACGDRASRAGEREDPSLATDSAAGTGEAALIARGRAVYEEACAECHAVQEPPLTAPTLEEISRAYHAAFHDAEEAIDHLATYTQAPVHERSKLGSGTLDEWGVMPGLALPEEELRAVGRYIWELVRNGAAGSTPR
jgi:mono/diheme cytochrome c family protein